MTIANQHPDTASNWTEDLATIIEHAAARAGIPLPMISGEVIQIARNNLRILFREMANESTNLWSLNSRLIATVTGKVSYPLQNAVDVMNVSWRQVTVATGTPISSGDGTAAYAFDSSITTRFTNSAVGGYIGLNCGSATQIIGVRVLHGSSVARNLQLEYSSDGATWNSVSLDDEATSRTAGEWTYYELDTSLDYQYFRIVDSGSSPLDFAQVGFITRFSDIVASRLNRDQYQYLPNKRQLGNPLQYYVERETDGCILHLWLVPDSDLHCMLVVTHDYIAVPGALSAEIDIPYRWRQAIISSLAVAIASESPAADVSRVPQLVQAAAMSRQLAREEERDRAPIRWIPSLRAYNR